MSVASRAGVFFLIVVLLLLVSAFALNAIDMHGDTLFYYTANALFVSISVFGIPSCFFLFQNKSSGFGLYSIRPREALLSAVLGCSVFFICTAINAAFAYIAAALDIPVSASSSLPDVSGSALFSAVLVVCIIPAVTEEILFRGILLFSWRSMGRRRVIILTSLFFALMHNRPFSIPAIFFIAFILGEVAYDSRSVAPAIILHFTNNLLSLLFYNMSLSKSVPNASEMPLSQLAIALSLYLALGILLFVKVRKKLLASFLITNSPKACDESQRPFLPPIIVASLLLAAINILTFLPIRGNIFP